MDQLFQHAQRRRRAAVGDGPSDRIPASVKKQAIATIEHLGVLYARQTPKQHQAAAPHAILPSMVSTTRAPVSVCATANGVSP